MADLNKHKTRSTISRTGFSLILYQKESIRQKDNLVPGHFHGTATDRQYGLPVGILGKLVLVFLLDLDIPIDLNVAFLQKGNDGGVIVQHLEFPVYAGHGNRGYLTAEQSGFRGYDF